MSRRDVQLIIKAKTEGDRAVQALSDALLEVADSAQSAGANGERTGSQFASLARAVVTLENAWSGIEGKVNSADAAFQRQQATLSETKSQLSAVKAQIEGATGALTRFHAAGEADGADKAQYAAKIKAVEAAIVSLSGEERRLTGSIAAQESAIGLSRSSLQQLGSTANAVEAAISSVGDETQRAMLRAAAATEEQTRNLREQAAAAREAATADAARGRFDSFLGIGRGGKSASGSAAVFEDGARSQDSMAASAARLRAQIDPLGAIQDRLNAELAEANGLYKAGKISATELALAEKVLANNAKLAADALNRQGRGERGKTTMFGLKPYELTNLSYQLNDIVTQLASGTSLAQTLGQQGGQLIQIFPRVGSALFASLTNPAVLATTAGLGTLLLAVKRVGDEQGRLRTFGGALEAMGDGGRYSAMGLSESSVALDRLGMSAELAVDVVRTFVREGVDPSRIEQFGEAAQDMADVLGGDVKDAAKEIATAFTGGYDAILKLDGATQFLTASELEHIRVMFEGGKAAEARAEAFRIFSDRMDDGADKARGAWSDAFRSLGAGWDSLLESFGNTTPIIGVTALISALGEELKVLGDRASGIRSMDIINRSIEDTKAGIELIKKSPGANNQAMQARLASLERKLIDLTNERTNAAFPNFVQNLSDTIDQSSEALLKARNNATAAIQREREALYAVTDAQKVRLAGEEAYQAAKSKTSDEAVLQMYRELAIEKKSVEIKREHAKESERERKRREAQFASDISRLRRAQLSETASGFIGRNENNAGDRDVLKNLFKTAGLNVDPKMVAWCAAFVNAVLATNGLPGTGKLNARSFLNYGQETNDPQKGDIVVLKRGGNAAQGHVGFFQGFNDKGDVNVLGGNQGDGVNTKTFNKKDVLSFRRAPDIADVYAEAAKEEEKRVKSQEEFNAKVDAENEKRRLTIRSLIEQKGLTDDALFAEQKRQAVEEAVLAAQQEAAKKNIELDAERRAEIEKSVAAEWELTHAKEMAAARQKAIEKPVDDLSAQRSALMDQIEFYKEIGQDGIAEKLKEQLVVVNQQLSGAIAKAVQFWMSIGGPEAEAAILQLQNLQNSLIITEKEFIFATRQIEEAFAGSLTQSLDDFARTIGEGGNAIAATRDLFLGFAADFGLQIAKMLMQAAALKLAMKIGFGGLAGKMTSLFDAAPLVGASVGLTAAGAGLTAAGGVLTGAAVSWGVTAASLMAAAQMLMIANSAGSAGIFHGGGIAGAGSRSRSVLPGIFANAMRFHSGGIIGLQPNEVPTILQRGEEILTRSDPRHILNGGGGAGGAGGEPQVNVRNVNVFDASDLLSQALQSRVGERVVFNFIKTNSGAVNSALGR